jgi:putative flippase GtrA
MVINAIFGAFIGFLTYEFIYVFNPFQPRATSSWFIASVTGIARQHGIHRWLTFSSSSNYWISLRRAYVMYSGSIVLGLSLNWLLVEIIHLEHTLAWLCGLIVSSIISLIFLKKYVFQTPQKSIN